jgi:GrpB-like predicted nucleotidyltransferase (UPF0157 family)
MADALGLEPGVVRLVEYDVRWPVLFSDEQQRIGEHCGALSLRLEHIGGTSIPDMCAKPIIDIAAAWPPDVPIDEYIAALKRAGYEHRGECGVPGREYFRRGQPRAYHLHLVEEYGSLWRGYLAFRDYLRTHPDDARRFAELKRRLAASFANDREGYLKAKAPHVDDVLRRAATLTSPPIE